MVATRAFTMRSLLFETFDKTANRQYLGNEKIFTLRIPFGESKQTFTFPKVKYFYIFYSFKQKNTTAVELLQ